MWIPKGIIHSNMVSRDTASSSFSNMFTSLMMFSWCLANTFLAESKKAIFSYSSWFQIAPVTKRGTIIRRLAMWWIRIITILSLIAWEIESVKSGTNIGQQKDIILKRNMLWEHLSRSPPPIFVCALQDFQARYPSQDRCLLDIFDSDMYNKDILSLAEALLAKASCAWTKLLFIICSSKKVKRV